MTAPSSRPTQCPHCGYDNHVETYESINSHDRQLCEKLLSGALWMWQCAKCGKHTFSLYPVLYHDMRSWCMIYYLDRQMTEDPRVIERMVPSADKLTALRRFNLNYRFRLCRSLEDFIEKLRILDAGLDDRAVEYLKLRNRSSMALEGRFERLIDEEPKRLGFGLSPFSSAPAERMVRSEIAYPVYADALAKIKARFGSDPDVQSGFIVVDTSYIEQRFAEAKPATAQPRPGNDEPVGNMGSVVFGKMRRSHDARKPWWRFW
jgi:hypothetical protein